MAKESHLEFKVGLFVLIAVAAFTGFLLSISDTSVFKNGKKLNIVFGFANGLKKNAPVRIAGVDEGIVKDIKLFFDRQDGRTKAKVELWINRDTQIPNDSTVMINQLGLLGEKYIEIVPGIETKTFFQEGETIIGKDPVSQEVLSSRVMDVAKKLEETFGGVSKIVNDEENLASIRATLKELSSTTAGVNQLVAQTNSGNGTIGKLFYDDRMYENLQGLTADLKENPWKLLYKPKNIK
jgi:phospholipid/cholesterol/gamma-HCH transport system substrate-binding protein